MLQTSYVQLNNSISPQNMQKMNKSEVKEGMSNEVSPLPHSTIWEQEDPHQEEGRR